VAHPARFVVTKGHEDEVGAECRIQDSGSWDPGIPGLWQWDE